MKKTIALLLAVLMLAMSLGACSSDGGSGSTGTDASTGSSESGSPSGTYANKLEKIKAEGKITMITSPDFAPYEFVDLSKEGLDSYVGCDIELAKYIAEKLGVELVIEAMEFSACQGAITQGEGDISIANYGYTEERAESCELSIPFDTVSANADGQCFLVLKERAEELSTLESFSGKTIGVQNGSLQYNLLVDQVPEANVELVTEANTGVAMVKAGKIDAMLLNGSVTPGFLDNYPELTVSDYRIEFSSEGNVVMMEKGQTELCEAINEIIEEVNEKDLYTTWKANAKELAKELGWENS